jgi:hypothetical protein
VVKRGQWPERGGDFQGELLRGILCLPLMAHAFYVSKSSNASEAVLVFKINIQAWFLLCVSMTVNKH